MIFIPRSNQMTSLPMEQGQEAAGKKNKGLFQIRFEKFGDFIKGNHVDSIVKINMPRAGNDNEFLGFSCHFIGILSEIP